MTKRNTEFTLPEKPQETEINPLQSFFRKSKLELLLPSRGQWYPENSLTLNANGGLSIFAMTATDDIKFRTGDPTLTGTNIYSIISDCAPGILHPEEMPHVDIDAVLLAIRVASYGDEFAFSVTVPNTTLKRKITIISSNLLKEIIERQEKWDEEIIISDETMQTLSVNVQPIPMKYIFSTSKSIVQQKKIITRNFDEDENIKDESAFNKSMESLTNSAIDLLCSSVKSLKLQNGSNEIIMSLNASNPQDNLQIKHLIKNLDIGYFNAIRDHIEEQRKKYLFYSDIQTSNEMELAAGAEPTWRAELSFIGSDFLPEQKINPNII